VTENVWEQFLALLASGTYKLGEKLPPESAMCEELHVSRAVLREVLRTLRFLGCLETVQGGGTYISKMPLQSAMSEIKIRLALEKSQLLNVWDVRYILEVEIAGMAATLATDGEIKEILNSFDNYVSNVKGDASAEQIISSTKDFHTQIAKATHNPVLVGILANISDLLTKSRESSIQVEGSSERASEYHRRIAQAIAKRDRELAKQCMREHLEDVRRDLIQYFETLGK
jgi:GntR family transcriptional repressor for pyruvate dehydrogenase complex